MKIMTIQSPADKSATPHKLATISNKIFIGLMLATPVMATVWIFNFILRLTTSWFPRKLFPHLDDLLNGYILQILVLILVLVFFYLLGTLAHNFFGKRLYKLADRLFSGIPIIKNIYTFVRQVCEWVARSRNTMFNSVVLVEYPRKGCYVIGLVTSATSPVITSKIPGPDGAPTECVNVFIATTPNPTSGFFLIFPKSETTPLDMDISDAINMIISAGAILPQKAANHGNDSMLDMIDSLITDPHRRSAPAPDAATP